MRGDVHSVRIRQARARVRRESFFSDRHSFRAVVSRGRTRLQARVVRCQAHAPLASLATFKNTNDLRGLRYHPAWPPSKMAKMASHKKARRSAIFSFRDGRRYRRSPVAVSLLQALGALRLRRVLRGLGVWLLVAIGGALGYWALLAHPDL